MDLQSTITKIESFLRTYCADQIAKGKILSKKHLIIDFKELMLYDLDLANKLLDSPEETISLFNIAVKNIEQNRNDSFTVRFKNISETTFKDINTVRYTDCGKLITIEGMIRQKSDVRPRLISVDYECPACGNMIKILQNSDSLKKPSQCTCGRKSGFIVRKKEAIDIFSLIVEEPTDLVKGGVKLARMKVLAKSSLTNKKIERNLYQGARVRISGVLKEFVKKDSRGKETTDLDWYLDANYMELIGETFEELTWSKTDVEEFKKLAGTGRVLEIFRKNIFYDVKGYEEEAEAVILQMFGGVTKKSSGADTRGHINIFFCGDPGTSKSTMLKIADKFAPKSMYVAGSGVSGVGLTGAVVKDELLGGFTFEAGAIPLCNNAQISIDELDKIGEEHIRALHEPLSEGTVSINKATVNTTLQANTAVLAAANPKYGEFSDHSSIFSQIDLESSIIDRFDLVYVMKVSDLSSEDNYDIAMKILSRKSLTVDDLKSLLGGDFYERSFLQKYVAYAKSTFNPVIGSGVKELISDFHKSMFEKRMKLLSNGVSSMLIGARSVDSVLRIAEAIARSKLHEVITIDDASEAIDKLRLSVEQINPDFKNLDSLSSYEQINVNSKKQLARLLIGVIEKLCVASDNNLALEADIVKVLVDQGFSSFDVDDMLYKLRMNGDVISPKPKYFKLS